MKSNVIVGAGQAGAHAAIAMRRAGFDGHIMLIGAEATAPYDRPPLSKSFITAPDEEGLSYFFSAATFAMEGIELLTGVVVEGIDPAAGRVQLARGGTVPFDRLVLATGSAARTPDVPGKEHILVLRTFLDAIRIRQAFQNHRNVVCIGAGVIGLELASAACARGCRVTVVEKESAVMGRTLRSELADIVADIHRRAGVELIFETEVESIEPSSVLLGNGILLPADVVIAGIGIQRNTSLADAAGMTVAQGILTDATGRTNLDGIFAAGEVAEFYSPRTGSYVALESWRHAQDHGTLVGRSAAGLDEIYDSVPWFWTDQHGVNIQVAGNGRSAVRTVYRGDPKGDAFCAFELDGESRVVGAVGFNAGRDVSAATRLIRNGHEVDPNVLLDSGLSPRKMLAAATANMSPT